jgi:hydrogenase maturation protease
VAPTEPRRRAPRVLVGGIGELYQGDLDVGRLAVERLAGHQLGDDVLVEDLSYGAVAVAQRLQELQPGVLVLVGAAARGRPPGTVERRRVAPFAFSAAEVRQAVAEAVTGYVSIDLALEVASGLGALPAHTVVIEAEPATVSVRDALSPRLERSLDEMLSLVRAELRNLAAMTEQRRTEQGDEVTEEHSIEPEEGKPPEPYRPPRQPAQAHPEEPVQRGGAPGGEAAGDEPRKAPGS